MRRIAECPFGVDPHLYADWDERDAAIDAFLELPAKWRRKMAELARQIAATPLKEAVRICNDIDAAIAYAETEEADEPEDHARKIA